MSPSEWFLRRFDESNEEDSILPDTPYYLETIIENRSYYLNSKKEDGKNMPYLSTERRGCRGCKVELELIKKQIKMPLVDIAERIITSDEP